MCSISILAGDPSWFHICSLTNNPIVYFTFFLCPDVVLMLGNDFYKWWTWWQESKRQTVQKADCNNKDNTQQVIIGTICVSVVSCGCYRVLLTWFNCRLAGVCCSIGSMGQLGKEELAGNKGENTLQQKGTSCHAKSDEPLVETKASCCLEMLLK